MASDDVGRRPRRIDRLFVAVVVLPTMLAALYFGFIASDVYISESRFVVRSPERQATSPLGLMFKGAGLSRADDDAFAVQDFMLSRDAAKQLDHDLRIKQRYSALSIDRVSRFPGFDWDDSFENFHRYYQKRVEVELDSTSSIGTLTVRAYTAGDAHAINRQLLEYAEALVNRLNERARQDLIRYAAGEAAALETKAKAAALALADYRNQKGVIDPEKQAAIPLQQIAKLQEELIATKAQMLQIERVARKNPQLPILRLRARMLKQEIQDESQRVAGSGLSLASKAPEYHSLTLEKEFADKMLASALSTLEHARNEAQHQQLYLERIAQPSLPDAAMEPKRLRNSLATFIVSIIIWGILTLLIAGVKEHRE